MAEAVVLVALRWVALPIFTKFINRASTYLDKDVARELQELEATVLPQFQLVIEAAEKSPHRGKIEGWLRKLKAAFYDAEDLLDEHEYDILESEAEKELICKLEELKEILAEAKSFRSLFGIQAVNGSVHMVTAPIRSHTNTTSLPTSKVIGRKKDRDLIIDTLCKHADTEASAARCYSTLAIVGIGGMGKTTLAQFVYNNEKCKLRDMLQRSERFLLVLDDIWFDESKSETEWDWEQLLAPLVSSRRGSKILVTSRWNALPAVLDCKKYFCLKNLKDTTLLAIFKGHAFAGAETNDPQLRRKLEEIAEKISKRLGQSPLAAKAVGSQLSRKKDITTWRAALKSDSLSETRKALLWSYEKLDPRLQRCFLHCSLFPKGYWYKISYIVHLWVAEGLVDSSNSDMKMEDIGRDYFNELVSGSFFQQVSKSWNGIWYIMHDLFHDLAESLSREDFFRLEDDKVKEIPCTVRHLSVRVKSMKLHKQNICKLNHLRTVICIDPLMDDGTDVFDQVLRNQKKLRVLDLSFYNSSKLSESVCELQHLRYLNIVKTFISELPRSLCTLYLLQSLKLNNKCKILPDKLCNLSKLRHLEGYIDQISSTPWEAPVPQIPNIGKLFSLQHINEFHVQKQKGYELRQLRDMNELGGRLHIMNLENVTGKDEALESMLHHKSYLKDLQLVWSCKDELNVEDSLYLESEILEGLVPPPQLEGLAIEGYRCATYPSWLKVPRFENLVSFELENCSALEDVPLNTEPLSHCAEISLKNISNLKTLPCFPAGLTYLLIEECPLLMFISNDEVEQQEQWENMTRADHFASQLALFSEADPDKFICGHIRKALLLEHSFLKQLMTKMDADLSENLRTIESALQGEIEEALLKESIIKAWVCCHELRRGLVYQSRTGLQLVPPSGLVCLFLISCSITDSALSSWFGSLTALKKFRFTDIMTLTTLPSEEVFRHSKKLEFVDVEQCWCIRSLGGLRASASLITLGIMCYPSLQLARGSEYLPLSLEDLRVDHCVLTADFFCSDLPKLKKLYLNGCRSSASMSVGRLTSVESFDLRSLPDLCTFEGLSSLQFDLVQLIDVPKLTLECTSQFSITRALAVSNPVMLNHMLSAKGFTATDISLHDCKDPSVSLEVSANLTRVKSLELLRCEMKSLPTNLRCLSGLEKLAIWDCPNISTLPDLPSSLQHILIEGCELLKKSCRAPDGESWPKIAHIRWKEIE
uniref:Rx N-terminal domain-containing protein n=1 Tax=Oryza meridionalis TaxID=40149 RepID=A0A0E0C8J3_9ORYZ